ncbi:GL11976 [Drosophila persimilis]|uniref:GL11976 n=1 Tax=Drosophila persimilis TaxID=7234 RepID=B4GLT6_DROPE|nr:DNA ligase 1 [Drosophila persimilis]EDW38510.1 GL11976 [Drosophila persimilis]
MPEDLMIPAGHYKVRKRFRQEEVTRKKRDIPWQKKVLDLDNNQLFGRTAWAWFRIVGFYLLLYFLIFFLVATWLIIFHYAIIPKDHPRWTKGAPGLSVVPSNTSTISWYTHLEKKIYPIADTIDNALKNLSANAATFFHECNPDTLWGYGTAKTPCVFVKINKVYGFTPKTYDSVDDLPSSAPDELDDILGKYGGKSRIWLTCKVTKGASPTIVYIPGPYYDASNNMKGVTRMVALKLTEMPQNQEVSIKCVVWAKNMPVDEKIPGKGNVKFSLRMRVDSQTRDFSESRRLPFKPRAPRPHIRKTTKAVQKPKKAKKMTESPKKQEDQEEEDDDDDDDDEDDDDAEEENEKETTTRKRGKQRVTANPKSKKVTAGPKRKKVTQHSKEEDDENTEEEEEEDDEDEEIDNQEDETEKPNKNKAPKSPKEKKVTASPKGKKLTVRPNKKKVTEPPERNVTKDSTARSTQKQKKVNPKKATVTKSQKRNPGTVTPEEEEDWEDEEEDENETTTRAARKKPKVKPSSKQKKPTRTPKKQKVTEGTNQKIETHPPKKTNEPTEVPPKPKKRKVTESPKTKKVTETTTPGHPVGEEPPVEEEFLPELTEFNPYFEDLRTIEQHDTTDEPLFY